VIGDAVNEAARLTELAKQRRGRLLASEAVLARARRGEAARWRLEGPVELRGRPVATRIAIA
jgi:adenylate cyclase